MQTDTADASNSKQEKKEVHGRNGQNNVGKCAGGDTWSGLAQQDFVRGSAEKTIGNYGE